MMDNDSMPNDTTPLREYFEKLDLDQDVARIYLNLREYGPQNLLQLSRSSNIERTRLYRLLDTLTSSHLIETDEEYKRKIYRAAPISNLQILLARKEQEIVDLRVGLLKLQDDYEADSIYSPLTHVQFYRGVDGLKQMLWNEARTKGENLSILLENMQNSTGKNFFERWVELCNENDIPTRSIVSDHFLSTQKDWYARHDNERLKDWKGRYISKDILQITHSMVIYDDVVAFYNWKDGEVFGIELHNQEIAATQRSLFEILWQQGKPIASHGEAE
jgi:transcriptional regulator TrmB